MGGEWRTATVSELQRDGILLVEDGNHGEYRPRPDEFVDDGVAFIRAADMHAGRVQFESASKINERVRQRITKGIGAPGDVLLSHKGTVGKVALVPDDAPPFVCSPQTTFWRTLDLKTLDRQYLYAFLRSPGFHAQLATRAGETDMAPYVSLTSQRGLLVTLPPISIQRAIAHILSALDDKIELNRRMNETLEAIARALFKSWFVKFDPVRAKAFDLEAEGILEIGDGYRAKNSELGLPGLPFIRAGDVNNGFDTDGAEYLYEGSVAKVGSKTSRAGDVAFTSKGTVGRVARVGEHNATFVYSPQVCFWRSLDSKRLHPAVLYCWMQSADFRRQINVLADQTDMAPYVSLRDQRNMQMPRFPASEQRSFGEVVQPLLERHSLNVAESRTVAALLDTLLPKLISGDLRIKDAERVVGNIS